MYIYIYINVRPSPWLRRRVYNFVHPPVTYLDYGPFSSHLPVYDSSMANITKEESDLLYSTYGSDVGIQYSKRYYTISVDSYYDNSNVY